MRVGLGHGSHRDTRRVQPNSEGAVMKFRVLLAAAATLALAACADSPTAAPSSRLTPGTRSSDDISCRSGYRVATRSDGSEYCEADAGAEAAAGQTSAP
jgi:hypothetical protein